MAKPRIKKATSERGVYPDTNEAKNSGGALTFGFGVLFLLSFMAGGTWFVPIILIGGCALFTIFHESENKRSNIEKDEEITKTLNSNSDEIYREIVLSPTTDHPPFSFSLYLRPFYADDYHYCAVAEDIDYESYKILSGRYYPLDFRLLKFSANKMVCVGNGEKDVGIGSIKLTDEQWKPPVNRLIDCAETIFILPSTSESMLWELEKITQNISYLEKTYFIMPPAPYIVGERQKEWDNVKTIMDKMDLILPEYDRNGCAIKFSGESKVAKVDISFFFPRISTT